MAARVYRLQCPAAAEFSRRRRYPDVGSSADRRHRGRWPQTSMSSPSYLCGAQSLAIQPAPDVRPRGETGGSQCGCRRPIYSILHDEWKKNWTRMWLISRHSDEQKACYVLKRTIFWLFSISLTARMIFFMRRSYSCSQQNAEKNQADVFFEGWLSFFFENFLFCEFI